MAMTLEEALATLRATSEGLHSVANACSTNYRDAMQRRAVEFDKAVAVIDAHLTQPAQAVDVDSLYEVIRGFGYTTRDQSDEIAEAVFEHISTRALSAEKAGWRDESRAFLAYRLNQMAEGGPLAFCADTLRDAASWLATLPASPTPDKEG